MQKSFASHFCSILKKEVLIQACVFEILYVNMKYRVK